MNINEIQKSRFNEIEASVLILTQFLKGKCDENIQKELDRLAVLIKEEKENRYKISDTIWALANKL